MNSTGYLLVAVPAGVAISLISAYVVIRRRGKNQQGKENP